MVSWHNSVALVQKQGLRAWSNLHKNYLWKIYHDITAHELLWAQSLSKTDPWCYINNLQLCRK